MLLSTGSALSTYWGLTIAQWITLGGIFVTLGIGIWNLVNSLIINRRTVYVNAITSERVKWMGQLKELMSEYLSLTTFYEKKPVLDGKELSNYFERLIFLRQRIKLHLNYKDKRDEEINKLIENINNKIFGLYELNDKLKLPVDERIKIALSGESGKKIFTKVLENLEDGAFDALRNKVIDDINADIKKEYGYKGRDELIMYTDELVEKTRIYLKAEWEKVKHEAKKGKLTDFKWMSNS